MKTTFKTFAPLFPGFYNTIFEPFNEDDEISEINKIRSEKNLPEIDFDDCEFNYNEYEENISLDVCYNIANFLQDILSTEVNIKKEALISPKFYNYSNDSINIEIQIDKSLIIDYLINNFNAFKYYIEKKYTSCSGFISSYSNNAYLWIEDIKNENFDASHKLGSILDFILTNEGFTDLDLYHQCNDSTYIYVTNYDELTEA